MNFPVTIPQLENARDQLNNQGKPNAAEKIGEVLTSIGEVLKSTVSGTDTEVTNALDRLGKATQAMRIDRDVNAVLNGKR